MSIYFLLLLKGIAIGSCYALIALSYNVIYSTTKVVNFAQGSLLSLGGLMFFTFFVATDFPYLAALIATFFFVAVVCLANEWLAIRKQLSSNHLPVILSTFGFGLLVSDLSAKFWVREAYSVPSLQFFGRDSFFIAGSPISAQEIWIFILSIIAMIATEFIITRTRLGKQMQATSYNREAAELMGISTNKIVLFTFILSGVLVALAGSLIAPMTYASHNMGVLLGLKGFSAVVIGGLGSYRGAIVGGFLVGVTEMLALGFMSSSYAVVISFLLMIMVLIIRPQGLFAEVKYERV